MTGRSGHVLVVDDNATNVRLLEAILSSHGYRVSSAADGAAALAALAAAAGGSGSSSGEAPDLMLLDIQMPGIDGFEVCRRLRADPATEALPVIMVTAAGSQEKLAALDAGADDFLPRPFEQAELLARVRSLLRMKYYRDQALGQAAELAAWNRALEDQVRERVAELERMQGLRRFLSSRVAEIVLAAGEGAALLEPHRREVAILFCDLRGFTAFSVSAEPEEVVGALKQFHRLVGGLIAAHGGTVGPFTGDGMMVIFNDPVPCPAPALDAVRMALELRDEVSAFEAQWRRRGHVLSAGIGVTFGYATLGVMGFDDRSDYMAVGPVVNLASRLCDSAAGGEILVSPQVVAQLEASVVCIDKGRMELRGFPYPQPVYAVERLQSIEPDDAEQGPDDAEPGPAASAAGAGGSAAPTLSIGVLGPLSVCIGGQELAMRSARDRELLLLLLLQRRRVLPVERLAAALRSEAQGDDGAVAALRVQVSRLRKTLAAAGLERLLVTKPNGYLLDVEDACIDAARFLREVEMARAESASGDLNAAAQRLRDAIGLWRGSPYAELTDHPAASAEQTRLNEARLLAVEDLMDAEIGCGRHREVLGELEALVAEHPLRERLWAALMLAQHRAGRQPDALRSYQELRRRLADDLGLDPSPELSRLHQSILTRDSALEPAEGAAASARVEPEDAQVAPAALGVDVVVGPELHQPRP
jgi:class 3 adenylate cyclase/DNA-binding SARP family transcriptional activator/ActR/RegA family two-component response regulator